MINKKQVEEELDQNEEMKMTKEEFEQQMISNPEAFKKKFMIRDSFTKGEDLELAQMRE